MKFAEHDVNFGSIIIIGLTGMPKLPYRLCSPPFNLQIFY